MPYKDPTKRLVAVKAWQEANPDRVRTYRETDKAKRRKKRQEYPEVAVEENARSRAWQALHPDIVLSMARRYRLENREAIRLRRRALRLLHAAEENARCAAWRRAHPEKQRAAEAAWRTKNPDKAHAQGARRRARQRAAPQNDFTGAQWLEMKAAYGYRCVYCDRKMQRLTMDHLTPLSMGGSHTASNIVPACISCNARKSTGSVLIPVQPLLLTLAVARIPRKEE